MSIFVKDIPVLGSCYLEKYILLEQTPKYHYVNRIKTSEIEGYYYTILVPHNEQNLQVKVKVLSTEKLDLTYDYGTLPLVSFQNLKLTYYLSIKKRSVDMIGEADSVRLVNDDNELKQVVIHEELPSIQPIEKNKEKSVLSRLSRSFTD